MSGTLFFVVFYDFSLIHPSENYALLGVGEKEI